MTLVEIETLLATTLQKNEDIEALCGSVSFVVGKPPGPYVTYEIYNSREVSISGCTGDATRWFIQVDIFTNESYMALKNAIRKAMLQNGFEVVIPGIVVDDKNFNYHWYSRWSIDLENDVKEIIGGI